MTRLLVIQPAVVAYRAPFFERVIRDLREHQVEATVATGGYDHAGRCDESSNAWNTPVQDLLGPTRVGGLRWRRWREAVRTPDLVIVEQAVKNLETYPLVARQRFGGPRLAMWGHGRSYSTRQGPIAATAKQFLTRRCDWFFAYTQSGADHVISRGFPPNRVSVLNNTIDTDALRRDLEAVTIDEVAAFSRCYGLVPGRTALFIGGVDKAKGIDFLLESASEAAALLPGFVLLVGGSGEQLKHVQTAARTGAPVRALGRLDGQDKALALRAADVLTLPSSIGLVAVDSLVAGVPIVTRDNGTHGPEADYLLDGANSLWVPTTSDSLRYASALTSLLSDKVSLEAMRDACLAEAPRHSLDSMVDAFIEGVLAWRDTVDFRLE